MMSFKQEGWGGIRARDAGNMVKRAIELAEQQLLNKRLKQSNHTLDRRSLASSCL